MLTALKRRIARIWRWTGERRGPTCGYAAGSIIRGEREREAYRDDGPRRD